MIPVSFPQERDNTPLNPLSRGEKSSNNFNYNFKNAFPSKGGARGGSAPLHI